MDLISSRKHFIIILFIISALVFLFNLGGRDLWDPDEARYGVVAREMRESRNWILPDLNGTIYAEKPPLFFWFVNLSIFFLGEDSELANRLPSALAGLISILLTFLFGEKLFNTGVGFLSGLVLATCFFFPQISRWMMLDSLFTLFFLLSLFYFYEGFKIEERRRRRFLFAGLFMGLGVLTKGPIAYLTLPIFVIFAFLQKEIKKFWNRNLILAFLFSLGIVSIWLIPACLMGGEDYTKQILFGQTLGRLAGDGKHFHSKPFYFYFIRFPIEFLPWVVFIPTAFISGFNRMKEKRREFSFITIWFTVIFLFFSLSSGKKDNYLLPLYPAAALIVGGLWDSGLQLKGRQRGFILGFTFLTSLSLITFALYLLGVPQRLYSDRMPYHFLIFSILSYLVVGLPVSLLLFINEKKWASFICLVITFLIFHLHISYSVPAQFNGQRSMKEFSKKVLKRMDEGDQLKMCFFRSVGLLYYTQIPFIEEIWNKDRFLELLRSPEQIFFVIQREDLHEVEKDLGIEIIRVEQRRVGHWNLVLISNQK